MACVCCLSAPEREALRRSKAIDRQLKEDINSFISPINVLLLGLNESGKSTFLQRVLTLHGREQDRIRFRGIIYHTILMGAKILVEARGRLGIPLEDPRNEEHGRLIASYHRDRNFSPEEFQSFVDALTSLWKDSGIQTTVKQSDRFTLSGSMLYFLKKMDIVRAMDYVPSMEDVFCIQESTCGVQPHIVDIKGVSFLFADGQRSLRQKWQRYIGNSIRTSILFFVDCSKFDQTIIEDDTTNYLKESVTVFDMIVNNPRFYYNTSQSAVTIFFNKTDILREKIKVKSIKDYFPDFHGDPHNLDDVQAYLTEMFASVRIHPSQELYRHFITATDTSQFMFVFDVVVDTILTHYIQNFWGV